MTRRILITSYVFPPAIGGVERASLSLARMLSDRGYDVTVVTMTREHWADEDRERFRVVRRPGARTLVGLVRGADGVVVNNPSLRLQWPLLLVRRPHVTVLHSALADDTLRHRVMKRLKVAVLRRSEAVVAVSRSLASRTPIRTRVIPNTFDAEVFRSSAPVERRPGTVVFLGRLVPQKGVDLLLDAVALLRDAGTPVLCTVVGDGPERAGLERRADALRIGDRVRFTGMVSGPALNTLLRQQTVMAVPSRDHEPFGITALEGLAAGCAVVVSDTGGPPEAVGPCGLVVPDGDAEALATAIGRLLGDAGLRERLTEGWAAHLDRHSPATIGAEYGRLLEEALSTGGGR